MAIQNTRLWGLYCCIYITLVALVAAAIAVFQVYLVPVEPHLRLQLWNDLGPLTGAGASCPTGSYDYDPGNGTGHWSFTAAGCASLCSEGLAEACVSKWQLSKKARI